MLLTLHNVTFKYESATEPLFESINAGFGEGWTGVVGANGAGKTTLLRIAAGELEPAEGHIVRPDKVIYCPQRTDFPSPLLDSILASTDSEACVLKGKLKIEPDWLDRWNTLSHGERKRAQIGIALWQEPDVLAVDEPTNHIDADARALLIDAMKFFKGIGLLVSHDREMLDSLCHQCLIINPPTVIMRTGGYTQTSQQAEFEDRRIRKEYDVVKQDLQRIRSEFVRRRDEASKSDRRKLKRRLDARDSSGREKIDRARISGADGKAGRLANQLEGRVEQARKKLSEFNIKRRYEVNFWMPGSRSHRNSLFTIPAGEIELGGGRIITFPELTMAPDDRIAVTGPNGAGKSTLIRHIMANLSLPEDKVIYLPQEIDMMTSRELMVEVNTLSKERLGQVMTIVSCLGSRPERLVGNTEISPGEVRKVLLALGVLRLPHLIVMDEPTNHLDLPSIECLEEALDQCPCGLLLVSHDFRFLSRLANSHWHLNPVDKQRVKLDITMDIDATG